jgi:hypothetical protein
MRTKSDIKINQNQTLRDVIENIIQLKKDKKEIKKIKRMRTKFGI